MTEISKARIERVAKAIMEQMFAPHELPITDPWLIERYNDTARAALLSVVAEIEEKIRADERESAAQVAGRFSFGGSAIAAKIRARTPEGKPNDQA